MGATKDEVIGVLKKRYGVTEQSISAAVIPKPLNRVYKNRQYVISSALSAIIYTYHPMVRLFLKTSVGMTCNFDADGKLGYFTVSVKTDGP